MPGTGAANCNFWLGQSGNFQTYVKLNLKISIIGPNINRMEKRLCIFCFMGLEVVGKYSNIWLFTRVAVPTSNILQIFLSICNNNGPDLYLREAKESLSVGFYWAISLAGISGPGPKKSAELQASTPTKDLAICGFGWILWFYIFQASCKTLANWQHLYLKGS